MIPEYTWTTIVLCILFPFALYTVAANIIDVLIHTGLVVQRRLGRRPVRTPDDGTDLHVQPIRV